MRLGDGSKAQVIVTAAWALALAFLIVLTAAWNLQRTTASGPLSLVPQDPTITNRLALDRLRESKGRALPEMLPEIDRTIALDPLDGRPLLFHALHRILFGHPGSSLPTSLLEASRHQDPRLGETRLLLLDAYGRTGHAADAMAEAKSLMTLMPEQRLLVVRLIAGLAGRPGGAQALERALPASAVKGEVMFRLVQTGTDRALLMRLAAPMRGVARDPAQRKWVGAVVSAVASRPDPATARALWSTFYAVDPAQVGAGVADPEFTHGEGDPPFGWSFPPGEAGIAAVHDGAIEVYYYGRSKAVFASQMLLLAPGNYSLTSKASSSDEAAPQGLSWELSCANAAKPLVSVRLPLFLAPAGGTAPFSVPASGCTAQTLSLTGTPADLPQNQSARIERVQIGQPQIGRPQ